MIYDGFVGPSNRTTSRSVSIEETIGWYVEAHTAGTPKAPTSLQPVPGLKPFCGLASGPVSALFAQNGRAFAVGGGFFQELPPNGPHGTVITRGTMATSSRPATIASNGLAGNQVMVTSGGLGYIYNLQTNAFTQITAASFPPVVTQVLFFDGYFIVLATSGVFWLSDLEDGTSWNGLDFGAESQFSDTVVAMTKTHDNLWLFGTQNTGPWYNSGAADFPFTPIAGSLLEHGTLAPFSAVEVGNTVYWLGQDETGAGIVWRADGYTPTAISTVAISDQLSRASYADLQNSRAWAYQSRGHLFYVLQVPSLPETLVYDLTTQLWHKRALADPVLMRDVPYPGVCHAWAFGQHLVGDAQSSTVYVMDDTLGVVKRAA